MPEATRPVMTNNPWVLVDTQDPAFTVFVLAPPGIDPDIPRPPGMEHLIKVDLMGLQAEADRYIFPVVKNRESLALTLVDELVSILRQSPGTPIGLTWDGGLAITYHDYQAAKKRLLKHQEKQG